MFKAKAYIHHYQRYGYSEGDIYDSIVNVEGLLNDYLNLDKNQKPLKEKKSFQF